MKITNKSFFNEDAFKPSLWDESWDYIRDEGIILHESPKTIPYKEFPPILSRFSWGKTLAVAAPRLDWNSVLIPFSPDYHDEKHFKGHSIKDILTPLIEGTPSNKKYIASANPSSCFFAEIDQFKYEIFAKIAGTNEDIAFFLFDESLSYCFGFDFDFEYCFFSSENLKEDDERLKGTFAEWDKFFVDNFLRTPSNGAYHLKLFETVLQPSISRTINSNILYLGNV